MNSSQNILTEESETLEEKRIRMISEYNQLIETREKELNDFQQIEKEMLKKFGQETKEIKVYLAKYRHSVLNRVSHEEYLCWKNTVESLESMKGKV